MVELLYTVRLKNSNDNKLLATYEPTQIGSLNTIVRSLGIVLLLSPHANELQSEGIPIHSLILLQRSSEKLCQQLLTHQNT